MNHLTDEQFEAVLQGQTTFTEHLRECETCAQKLAEKKALSMRLRSAFAPVQAKDALAETIRHKVKSTHVLHFGRRTIAFSHWRYWAAAAAVLILIPFVFMFVIPTPAMAAKAELVKIHTHNLSGKHEFYSESDPEKLAAYFKDQLGFSPSMPILGQGMEIRGCCVRHFKEKIVGSYVVDTTEGVMSVIVVTDEPQTLGMSSRFEHQDKTFYKSTFAKCDLVAVRIDDYTYCAVGEISSAYLTDLLARLVGGTETH